MRAAFRAFGLCHGGARRCFGTAVAPPRTRGQPRTTELLRAAAETGGAEEMYALGRHLEDSRLGPRDPAAGGRQWVERAAAQGHPQALVHAGHLHLRASRPLAAEDALRAEQCFRAAHEKGQPTAAAGLTRLYLDPDSPVADAAAGLALLNAEAAKGNGTALYELYRLCNDPAQARRLGLDPAAALGYLDRAAEAGSTAACRDIARLLLLGADARAPPGKADGPTAQALLRLREDESAVVAAVDEALRILRTEPRGCPAALAQAKKLLRRVVALRSARKSSAMELGIPVYYLGEVYYREKDYRNASRFFRLATLCITRSSKHDTALMRLGQMALEGWEGVAPDRERGVALLAQAAEREPEALGAALLYGWNGLAPDVDRAEALLRKAKRDSKRDSPFVAYHLGLLCLLHRSATAKGAREAEALLLRAAELGKPSALGQLAELYRAGRPGVPANAAKAAAFAKRAAAARQAVGGAYALAGDDDREAEDGEW